MTDVLRAQGKRGVLLNLGRNAVFRELGKTPDDFKDHSILHSDLDVVLLDDDACIYPSGNPDYDGKLDHSPDTLGLSKKDYPLEDRPAVYIDDDLLWRNLVPQQAIWLAHVADGLVSGRTAPHGIWETPLVKLWRDKAKLDDKPILMTCSIVLPIKMFHSAWEAIAQPYKDTHAHDHRWLGTLTEWKP